MNILLVEDDDDKAAKIEEELRARRSDIELSRARSFDTALRALVRDRERLTGMILDMSMPNHDNSRDPPQNFAGRDLLRQCKLRRIAMPTVVVTMLDRFGVAPDQLTLAQLDQQLAEEFSPHYLGVVYYSSAQDTWKTLLVKFISEMSPKQ